MFIQQVISKLWLTCNITIEEVEHYRVIALSIIAAKMTNKMILNRIQPYIDPILRPNQNGFISGRSATSHILALRRLFEGVKSYNLKLQPYYHHLCRFQKSIQIFYKSSMSTKYQKI